MRMRLWCDRHLGTSLSTDADVEELATPLNLAVPRRIEPTLVLLDAGITVELSEDDRSNLRNVFKVLEE